MLTHFCIKLFSRALVIVIHGLAEHLGVYDELGQRLAADNMLAFGHDHGERFLPR